MQKKELKKTHIIYTCTTACIENVCTRGRDGLPACWELLAHEMLGVGGGVVEPQAGSSETRSETEQGRDPGEGLQLRLGPTAQSWGEGIQEGRARGDGMQEQQKPRGQEGCLCPYRPRGDEVMR